MAVEGFPDIAFNDRLAALQMELYALSGERVRSLMMGSLAREEYLGFVEKESIKIQYHHHKELAMCGYGYLDWEEPSRDGC